MFTVLTFPIELQLFVWICAADQTRGCRPEDSFVSSRGTSVSLPLNYVWDILKGFMGRAVRNLPQVATESPLSNIKDQIPEWSSRRGSSFNHGMIDIRHWNLILINVKMGPRRGLFYKFIGLTGQTVVGGRRMVGTNLPVWALSISIGVYCRSMHSSSLKTTALIAHYDGKRCYLNVLSCWYKVKEWS